MVGEGPLVCVKERGSAGDWKSSRGMVACEGVVRVVLLLTVRPLPSWCTKSIQIRISLN